MIGSIPQLETSLIWVLIVLYSSLAFKVMRDGLDTRYRFFSLYLMSNGIGLLLTQIVVWPRSQYFQFWLLFQTVNWLLAAMMVIELLQLILSEYPGLRTTGKVILVAAISIALVLSIASLGIDFPTDVFSQRTIAIAAVVHRAILFNLVIFLLVILTGLSWFPIQLNKNLKLHALLLFSVFFCEGFANLLRNRIGAQLNAVLTVSLFLFTIVVLTTWLLKLSKAGEQLPSTTSSKVLSGKEQLLLLQMRALDQALQKSLRK